jgi:hypothetical protein
VRYPRNNRMPQNKIKPVVQLCLVTVFGLTGLIMPQGSAEMRNNGDIWQFIEEAAISGGESGREITPQTYRTLRLNKGALQNMLSQAPMEFTDAARRTDAIITLPLPDGRTAEFRFEESPNIPRPGYR